MSFSSERFLRTFHSWLGVLILPWIIAIGLTGIYLNHWQWVNTLLAKPSYNEAQFDDWPAPNQQAQTDVIALANALWPDQQASTADLSDYHDRPAWHVTAGRSKLIVDLATGHYWIKTRFTRKTFDPDQGVLHGKIYWSALFKTIHEYGWFNSRFGTWLADITAAAMVLFGLSGIYLFTAPRLRRRKNRKARRSA